MKKIVFLVLIICLLISGSVSAATIVRPTDILQSLTFPNGYIVATRNSINIEEWEFLGFTEKQQLLDMMEEQNTFVDAIDPKSYNEITVVILDIPGEADFSAASEFELAASIDEFKTAIKSEIERSGLACEILGNNVYTAADGTKYIVNDMSTDDQHVLRYVHQYCTIVFEKNYTFSIISYNAPVSETLKAQLKTVVDSAKYAAPAGYVPVKKTSPISGTPGFSISGGTIGALSGAIVGVIVGIIIRAKKKKKAKLANAAAPGYQAVDANGVPIYAQPQYGQPIYQQPQYSQPTNIPPQYAQPTNIPPQYSQPTNVPPNNDGNTNR